MGINKKMRDSIFNKYHGKCAYTGKDLGIDWQVDHVVPKCIRIQSYIDSKLHDAIENLLPACRIINHYKRSLDLHGFRMRMKDFHIRLAKLPKKTNIPATQRRKDYMFKVAELFDITVDKPFCGVFYFETLK